MTDRARALDRLASAQRRAEGLVRGPNRVDGDVRNLARAVVDLTEAIALLLQPEPDGGT